MLAFQGDGIRGRPCLPRRSSDGPWPITPWRTHREPLSQLPALTARAPPLAGALGAEIPGLDLSQDASPELIAALREALLDHLVIFLPGQDLTPEQLVRFGRRFGTLATAHIMPSLPGVPEVMPLDSSTGLRTDIWHSDVTYYEAPPMGTLLYAREIPEVGGDTMFANMYLAYERLSPPIQRMLDPLTAVHSFTERFVRRINHRDQVIPPEDKPGPKGARPPLMRHPVVREHPETGRKALFVNATWTVGIAELTVQESDMLLEFLCTHAVQPEHTCRYRWSRGTIAFWANRCTQHYAINDYDPSARRVMLRMTLDGDRPRGRASFDELAADPRA